MGRTHPAQEGNDAGLHQATGTPLVPECARAAEAPAAYMTIADRPSRLGSLSAARDVNLERTREREEQALVGRDLNVAELLLGRQCGLERHRASLDGCEAVRLQMLDHVKPEHE